MGAIEFAVLEDYSIEKINKVINGIYGRRLPVDYTRWKYEKFPFGKARISAAIDGEEIVGIQSIFPINLVYKNDKIRATLFMDVGVLPEYRGRGLFKKLVNLAEEYALKEGREIILTFPNKISYPLFFRKLSGWHPIDNLSILLGFLPICNVNLSMSQRELKELIALEKGKTWKSWLLNNPYLRCFSFEQFVWCKYPFKLLNVGALLDFYISKDVSKINLLKFSAEIWLRKALGMVFIGTRAHPVMKQFNECPLNFPVFGRKLYFIIKPLKSLNGMHWLKPDKWAIILGDWDAGWGG